VLETGSDLLPEYDAARALYEKLGYAYCAPIPGYDADPNSAFMRLELAGA
jgi:putative acetyltransferase